MNKVKIAAVSYINTYPFIYGIEHSEYLKDAYLLDQLIPADCADALINNKADIGLIPVAEINKLDYSEIISDYCIGAIRNVKSVELMSNSELKNIKRIFLDYQSRTSVMLCRVLVANHWKIDVKWVPTSVGFEEIELKNDEGVVIIGDRVFSNQYKYKFIYDLASAWNDYTNKPFVFAAWVANKPLSNEFKTNFNKSLAFGVNHIQESLAVYNKKEYDVDLESYLSHNIDFKLDDAKRMGMNTFLDLIKNF